MFEVGFSEVLLLALVALLVLGPEHMPVAVRTVALTLGRLKRSYRQLRDDIEHEIGADDIRRQLHNEEVMARLARQADLSSLNPPSIPPLSTQEQQARANRPAVDDEHSR